MIREIGKQFGPAVVEFCGEVAREALRDWLRKRTFETRADAVPQTGESPPKDEGCPFCAAARRLAAAHLYLTQIPRSPANTETYKQLALKEVREAGDALLRAPADLDPRTTVLVSAVTTVEVSLSRPGAAVDVYGLATQTEAAGRLALELAERYQAAVGRGEDMARRMDERLAGLQESLEGTWKVVR